MSSRRFRGNHTVIFAGCCSFWKNWLHRGFLCVEVRYVEVPLSKFGDNFLFHRELQHVKEFFFASWLSCCMYPELFTTL